MNARRKRQSSASSVLTEPFEPGSTLKPFVAARLLALGRADPADMIETYDGEYVIGSRTIRDTHASDSLSLADVIRFSSNVGIVRFAERLTPGEQYEMLRDLGFGMATGVPFPSEAGGTLREPARWSNTSAASLAMGYEVAVTPLQLALAYAAIANGGELVEPALVQEIVKSDGSIHFQRERRVVRRVMTPAVASELRRMLASVVDSGTATEATLTTYDVGGKTGTARRATAGRYTPGAYTASFVALFPASEPQFVVVVKLDNPKGATYYGGTTAAPVSRALLQSAIAARDASLDQIALAELSPRATIEEPLRPTPSVTTSLVAITHSESQRVSLPAQESPVVRDLTLRPVPNVTDLPVRNAAQRLHAAGFRVSLVRDDKPGTQPAAGALVPGGSVVRLRYRQ